MFLQSAICAKSDFQKPEWKEEEEEGKKRRVVLVVCAGRSSTNS
jgi:hypothetical protein